jgi:hypothetical protein
MFFRANSCLLREGSARRLTLNVIVDIVSAIMGRGGLMLGSHKNDTAGNRSLATWPEQ